MAEIVCGIHRQHARRVVKDGNQPYSRAHLDNRRWNRRRADRAHVVEDVRHRPARCRHLFDFGGYIYEVEFATCPALKLDVTAYKSRPADVAFTVPPFKTSTGAVSPSDAGGFVKEIVIKADPDPLPGSVNGFRDLHSFFTQQPMFTPGLAKSEDTGIDQEVRPENR